MFKLVLEKAEEPEIKLPTSLDHGKSKSSRKTLISALLTMPKPLTMQIKRHLLLGRKVMINLDSILKSRDITLPTKVRLVKAMAFPVVRYECES